jgi:hypothetical protein
MGAGRTGTRPAPARADRADKGAMLAIGRVTRVAQGVADKGLPVPAASTGDRRHYPPFLGVKWRRAMLVRTNLVPLGSSCIGMHIGITGSLHARRDSDFESEAPAITPAEWRLAVSRNFSGFCSFEVAPSHADETYCPAETRSRCALVSSTKGMETAEASAMVMARKRRSSLSRFACRLRLAHVLLIFASSALHHSQSSLLASQCQSHGLRMISSWLGPTTAVRTASPASVTSCHPLRGWRIVRSKVSKQAVQHWQAGLASRRPHAFYVLWGQRTVVLLVYL